MKIHSYLLALLCGASALLQGCSSEDMPQVDVPDTQPTAHAKLSLGCVSNGTLTRSDTPFYELGFDNENAIYNAVIIVYDKPLNSADAASGHVKGKICLTKDQLSDSTASTLTYECKYYTTVGDNGQLIGGTHKIAYKYAVTDDADAEREVCTALDNMNLADNTTYFAIAIANIGNPDNITTSTTVAELRDMEYGGELYNKKSSSNADLDITTYNHFAMAGVNEVKFTTPSANTVDRLYDLGTLMVQRLAARIDVAFGTIDEDFEYDNGVFVFPIYDEAEYTKNDSKELVEIEYAKIKLTNIELLNAVEYGTYYFEHSSGTPGILGNEGWNDGVAQNTITSGSRTYATTNPVITNTDINTYHKTNGTGDYEEYSILGYVGENTFAGAPNSTNKYTAIKINAKTNVEFSEFEGAHEYTVDANGYHDINVSFNVRHSIGGAATNPLRYGIVRNTIYRMQLRFFANRNGLYVRWYWYDGTHNSGFTDHSYPVNFNGYIVDTETAPSND